MNDLDELRSEQETLKADLLRERPRAEAERRLTAVKRDPGVFTGSSAGVKRLEDRQRVVETAIARAQDEAAARDFARAYDENIKLWKLERELTRAIEAAQIENATALRDGQEALKWQRRFDRPFGFEHEGMAGWDHRIPSIEAGGKPIRASDEHRAQYDRIKNAESNLQLLVQRRASEAWTPLQNLTARYPVLAAVTIDQPGTLSASRSEA